MPDAPQTLGDLIKAKVLSIEQLHAAADAYMVDPTTTLFVFEGAGFVLLATSAGAPPRNPEWFAWDQLPAQLLLLQSYGVHGGLGWNAPTWSISALIGCYLAAGHDVARPSTS